MTAQLLLDLALFVVSVGFLVKATSIIIHALNNLSRSTKVELFALTGFFSAVATSLPELFVSITSAIANRPNMALGLVIGSNVTNITIVVGSVAIVGGSLAVVADFVKKDMAKAFGAISLPIILLIDGSLSRWDGMILLVTFGIYHITVFSNRHKYSHRIRSSPFTRIGHWLHSFNKRYQQKQFLWFALGIVMLLFSADMVVKTGTSMALEFNLPVILIGLFLVAFGTSLPEMAFEIRAVRNKQISMVFGDLLGSLVANSTLILGLTALISPIIINGNHTSYLIASTMFFVGFFFLWLFIRTKYKLVRWEGGVLISIYVIFFLLEFGALVLK